ncbi:MSP domain protein [Dictyocaulus viviparus]|uniref:Major sperm protein n=1 Tax=Dictyocaulus viviparus TaxID=29172 RepID=A0A0D8XQ48_DICVI|nr:MSP domain protein [Dictyocaulus viviparus]
MGDFKLQLEPSDKIIFSGKKLGEEAAPASIKITNTLKERIAYKVKCTSNEMFRIRPPVGALKPDDNVTVSLTFNAGKTVPDSGKHYFAVYYIKATDEKKAPRATWADHKGEPEGTKRLYIDFKKDFTHLHGKKFLWYNCSTMFLQQIISNIAQNMIESDYPPVSLPEDPYHEILLRAIKRQIDIGTNKVAFINGHQRNEVITFKQVYDTAYSIAAFLYMKGFMKDVACVFIPNLWHYASFFLGVTLRGGAISGASPTSTEC